MEHGSDARALALLSADSNAVELDDAEAVGLGGDSNLGDLGTLTLAPPRAAFVSKVSHLLSPSQIRLVDASPVTTATAHLFRKTAVLPNSGCILQHLPLTGGIMISGSLQPNCLFARQSKVYFPYQAGKGMYCSMAINFNPPLATESLSRQDGTATLTTANAHHLLVSCQIRVEGGGPGWDGTFVINDVPDENTMRFSLDAPLPDSSVAPPHTVVTAQNWSQSAIRTGMFDDQNGFYMEYDGRGLVAVRRNSMMHVPGRCQVRRGSPAVGGTKTHFGTNVHPRDRVVIRGMSYLVVNVASDSLLYVQPPYRGPDADFVQITKTHELRVPQSAFNVDRMDGSGPSGYNVDYNRTQMVVIEYSWYGVGAAQLGMKGKQGEFVPAHRFVHNNVMHESYMHSGSLPVRFEVATSDAPTYVPNLVHWGVSVMLDSGYTQTPKVPLSVPSNVIVITGPDSADFHADTSSSSAPALAPGSMLAGYPVALDASNYDVVKRLAAGTPIKPVAPAGAATVTVGSTVKTKAGGVMYLKDDVTGGGAGSSTDAQFTAGNSAGKIPYVVNLLSVRICPSVDNDRVGRTGEREVLNRMLIVLTEIQVTTTHDVDVDVVLSAGITPYTFGRVGLTSQAEVCRHAPADAVGGGLVIYSFKAAGGPVDAAGRRTFRTSTLAPENSLPMTNSALGGDGVYPDGPEVATLRVRTIDASEVSLDTPFKVFGSMSWIEK